MATMSLKIVNIPDTDALTAEANAKERVMLERVLKNAKESYKNPENRRAFEAWLKNKEENNHGTNNVNT